VEVTGTEGKRRTNTKGGMSRRIVAQRERKGAVVLGVGRSSQTKKEKPKNRR